MFTCQDSISSNSGEVAEHDWLRSCKVLKYNLHKKIDGLRKKALMNHTPKFEYVGCIKYIWQARCPQLHCNACK